MTLFTTRLPDRLRVSSVARDVHARYDGRPLRDYVPLFVERNATAELKRLGVTAG